MPEIVPGVVGTGAPCVTANAEEICVPQLLIKAHRYQPTLDALYDAAFELLIGEKTPEADVAQYCH